MNIKFLSDYFQRIKKAIILFVFGQIKCWGVEVEMNVYPEFFITDHAFQRMRERFNCEEKKIKKVVIKAWYSPQIVSREFIILKEQSGYADCGNNPIKYRIFQGHVFIFTVSPDKYNRFVSKRLITVYKKPEKSTIKRLPMFNNKLNYNHIKEI